MATWSRNTASQAYYLMDENGDGRLDRSKGASEKDISPVYWKLYGW